MKTEVLSAALLGAGVLVGAAQAAELSCGFTQVTNSTGGGSINAAISANGGRIAFESFNNLTGGNADGSREIFLYNVASTALTQVTKSARSDSFDPATSADGGRIAFHSDGNLTGGNADFSNEIFLYDIGSNALTQITSATSHSSFSSINADGSSIAFSSIANLTGGNGDFSNESFLYEVGTNALTQITNATGGNSGYPSSTLRAIASPLLLPAI